VCIGDYQALYVNDEFVGEARDRTFSTGFAGFVAVAPEGSFVGKSSPEGNRILGSHHREGSPDS